jgi:hypothetical protein
MAAGVRGGTLATGSGVKPDWNDEPSESMWLENPARNQTRVSPNIAAK